MEHRVRRTVAATAEALDLATAAARAAADKKATDVVVIDVSERLVITDVFVIASAPNERQVGAIVDNVEEKLRNAGHRPVRREGAREGRWVLSTTSTSWCTSNTTRSAPSTAWSGCGRTVPGSRSRGWKPRPRTRTVTRKRTWRDAATTHTVATR